MALQWTAALQNAVALEIFGVVYSSLRTHEATHLDNANTPAVPTSSPGGVAGEALTYIQQYAQWFEEAGATAGPDAWLHVYKAEVAKRSAQAFRRDDYKIYLGAANLAWDAAMESYSVYAANGTTLQDQSITPGMIRLRIMRHLVRRTPRQYVPIPELDLAIKWAKDTLWQAGGWEFRRRNVTIDIATASDGSAPTINVPSGETFDSIDSLELMYTDGTILPIRRVTSDEMIRLKATYTSTGRPCWFDIEDRGGGSYYWHFAPLPDAAYTVRAEVQTATPAFTNDATTNTTAYAKFSSKFGVLHPDLALAKVLRDAPHVPREEKDQIWDRVMYEVNALAQRMQSQGKQYVLAARDVYRDYLYSSSRRY